MKNWTTVDMPQRKDGLAVITGSTEGVGFEDALALSSAGWNVIMTGRNAQKGADAIAKIHRINPKAKLSFEKIDLANLSSIKDFAQRMNSKGQAIDLLINNAGVMTPPKRLETVDGFELQFGTNHLSHFALTAQLLPLLCKSPYARVVTVSSVANRSGNINFDDLQSISSYNPSKAYSQSKLANLIFALELQRQSEKHGWGITSIASHPGVSRTNLLITGAGKWSIPGIMRRFFPFLFQPQSQGALPTLFAATSPEAKGGLYYGPNKMSETRGFPSIAKIPAQAEDRNVAAKLWEVSQKLTNVEF
ncbi:NAD(P)-dependent dehydrogenase, short-chain alcohol dehydrogenase family [Chryseobacterium soldanellicola]|uniref:NAD(P)-dependent dehydrogenase, short-chain alcohol dehydrogenase family n=1 Tax=Chryseobacterium soldanellicola TaxID=311333 RepID=A0A1H1FUC3_9FLAO|nr:SDR family oxidoreductase [Chryseobacterium soldanellicola]SDR04481.1 NAD(P)-dependent dehydrogenase, short-chain alcohol dehydrogenase family [Chryseobacterium soldanellicola]